MAKQDRDVYMKSSPSPAVDTTHHNDGGVIGNLYDMAKGFISNVGNPVEKAQKAAQGNRQAVIDANVASQGG